MKRVLLLLLVLCAALSLIACRGELPPETEGETNVESADGTEAEETAAEVTPPVSLYDSRFPDATEPSVIYFTPTAPTTPENVFLSSLQGLAARYTDEHIYMGRLTDTFLPYMQKFKPDVTYTEALNGEAVSLWPLAKHYFDKGAFSGYILCTEANPVSVDIAISLSALLKAPVVIDTIQAAVDEIGYECILDVREYDDAWLRASEYWDRLDRTISFQASYTVSTCLIDWASFCGAYYTNYTGHVADEQIAKYEFLDDNAIVFGYNHSLGEGVFIAAHSLNNTNLIPTDFMSNLSVLRSFAQQTMTQPRGEIVTDPGRNVHTVTFIYSDGDNMCYAAGTQIGIYNHANKGSLPLGFGLPATSIDLCAPIMQYYYDTKTDAEEFIMSLSGVGYTDARLWTPEGRAIMSEELATFMDRSDLSYMAMLGSGWDQTMFDDFTEHDGIEGIFYVGDHYKNKDFTWSNGKPVVSQALTITGGENVDQFSGYRLAQLQLTRQSLCTDVTDVKAYSMYYVGAWCTGPDVIAKLVDGLGDNVEVVTPSTFMERIATNCKTEDAGSN